MNKTKPIYYSLDTLFKLCSDLRGSGKKICLTHGAFDLFHYAHLDLLQQSSAICDFLIVGVDSDSSVTKYKSYKRPIIDERQRTEIINELKCVDAVFVKDIDFDQESHIKLYKNLYPDVITIGSGFETKFKDIIFDEAASINSKCIQINVRQDPTTTSIIDLILDRYRNAQEEV